MCGASGSSQPDSDSAHTVRLWNLFLYKNFKNRVKALILRGANSKKILNLYYYRLCMEKTPLLSLYKKKLELAHQIQDNSCCRRANSNVTRVYVTSSLLSWLVQSESVARRSRTREAIFACLDSQRPVKDNVYVKN